MNVDQAYDRLCQLTGEGDPQAASHLAREASRRQDLEAFLCAAPLLQPSAEGWKQLCLALRRCPTEQLDETLQRLDEILALWPEALRVAPQEWRRLDNPRLGICRRINGLYHHQDSTGEQSFLCFYEDGFVTSALISSDKSIPTLLPRILSLLKRDHASEYRSPHPYLLKRDRMAILERWSNPTPGQLEHTIRFDEVGNLLSDTLNPHLQTRTQTCHRLVSLPDLLNAP